MSRTNASPELVDNLVQVSFKVQAILTRIAAAHDLSLIQVRMLGILRDRRPLMQELAAYLGLEKSSLSGLVDRAEQRALVERVPHPDDRRAMLLGITALGQKLVRAVEAEVAGEVGALVAALPKPDRERLTTLLGVVSEA